MNLTAIRAELGQLLEQIGGVRVYLQAEDSVYSSTATAQALVIRDGSPYVDYYAEGAMKGGQSLVRMVVEIVAPRTSMRSAQARIDELCSAGIGESRSIYDAVKPDDLPQTLNGEIHDLRIMSASGLEERNIGDVSYLGCDIAIEMLVGRLHT